MRRPQIIAGIDVGTTKILTVIAEANGEGLPVILGIGRSPSHGLKKGVVVDIQKTRDAIEDSVARAERMAGVNLDNVYVGVTGSHIRGMDTSGAITISNPDHEISETDRRRVIEEARLLALPPERKILHLVEQEYIVDGQSGVMNPVGMSAARLELRAHVITGSNNFLSNVAKCVEQIDLGIVDLVLEPIASAEAVLEEAEKSVGVALVDIGGGTSDLAIFREGVLVYTRIISIGSRHLDHDISICMGASAQEAERLKLEHGSCFFDEKMEGEEIAVKAAGEDEPVMMEKRMLVEVLEARMVEMLEQVHQAIQESGVSHLLSGGVVFTGGGSMIRGLKELATEILDTRVRIAKPHKLTLAKEVPEKLAVGGSAATGIGLVLYANKFVHRGPGLSVRAPLPIGPPGGVMRIFRQWLSRLGF